MIYFQRKRHDTDHILCTDGMPTVITLVNENIIEKHNCSRIKLIVTFI